MQLTYNEAYASIIDFTEMGYTIASQDRLWTVFIFDLWSEGEHVQFRYNRLFSTGIGQMWSYEMDGDVLVWTTRAEAEEFAEQMREHVADPERKSLSEIPEVYVMNWGDDARMEALVIGRYGVNVRQTPKFKGSEAAWQAMIDMSRRWREANA